MSDSVIGEKMKTKEETAVPIITVSSQTFRFHGFLVFLVISVQFFFGIDLILSPLLIDHRNEHPFSS